MFTFAKRRYPIVNTQVSFMVVQQGCISVYFEERGIVLDLLNVSVFAFLKNELVSLRCEKNSLDYTRSFKTSGDLHSCYYT